jgi:DNA-binding HxlR family transcriptional regulator
MQESVIYQDILEKARKQEAILIIKRLLNKRFSQLDSSLMEQVQRLTTQQLEDLVEAFVDFSEVGDLVAWLNQQKKE